MPVESYKIVRKHFKGEDQFIKGGLTLEEAQEHCSRDDTRGSGWFDVYYEENPDEEKVQAREERFHNMVHAMRSSGLVSTSGQLHDDYMRSKSTDRRRFR